VTSEFDYARIILIKNNQTLNGHGLIRRHWHDISQCLALQDRGA